MRIVLTPIIVLFMLGLLGPAQASNARVVDAVNSIRAAHGLPLLRLHPRLQSAAQYQSATMAKTRKMAHTAARGVSFQYRLKRFGYRGLAAENIARGQTSVSHVLKVWMGSTGHRRNILHPRMRYFGLSTAKGGGRNYWTMVLGGVPR